MKPHFLTLFYIRDPSDRKVWQSVTDVYSIYMLVCNQTILVTIKIFNRL